jgi:hypothetical protein
MCTEVGQKKKKCSGGGAGQSGVHDYGFYGSIRFFKAALKRIIKENVEG